MTITCWIAMCLLLFNKTSKPWVLLAHFLAEVTYPIGSMILSHKHDDFSELNLASPITGEVFLVDVKVGILPLQKRSFVSHGKKIHGRILSMSYPGSAFLSFLQ